MTVYEATVTAYKKIIKRVKPKLEQKTYEDFLIFLHDCMDEINDTYRAEKDRLRADIMSRLN